MDENEDDSSRWLLLEQASRVGQQTHAERERVGDLTENVSRYK